MTGLLVIGLDGLDCGFVEKWKMNTLKQSLYGKHYVGFSKILYTPILWGCFMTGRNVACKGYDLEVLKEKRKADIMPRFLRPIYKIRVKLFGKRKLRLRRLLVKMGAIEKYPPEVMPKDLIGETFIELAKHASRTTQIIEVPGYNERLNAKYRSTYSNFIFSPLSKKCKYLNEVMKDCSDRTSKAIDAVKNGYDVVFLYFPVPDVVHHLLFKGIKEIVQLRIKYGTIAKLVKPLLEEAYKRDYIALIVSDHGFDPEKYYHTDYGFWSLNIRTTWRPERITDFYPKILEWIE